MLWYQSWYSLIEYHNYLWQVHKSQIIFQSGLLEGHWTSVRSSLTFSKKKKKSKTKQVEIFTPLKILALIMTAYWFLHSKLIYFHRNMNISRIFYFLKSTSINTQYSQWPTGHSVEDAVAKDHIKTMLWQNQLNIFGIHLFLSSLQSYLSNAL